MAVFVTIQLSRMKRADEVSLLDDLREICEVSERRAFGLSYSCKTDAPGLKAIKKVLGRYEREKGLELAYCREPNSSEGEDHVFALRPWTGSFRTLSNGQYQVRHMGKLLLYNSKQKWRLDAPMRCELPFKQFA